MKSTTVSTLPLGAESSKNRYIGDLVKLTGASAKAIRLYEALGLLGPIARDGRYRVYQDEAVQKVRFIRQALALDLRLAELGPILNTADGEPNWTRLLRQLEDKQAKLDQEMQAIQQLQAKLLATKAEIQHCLMHPEQGC